MPEDKPACSSSDAATEPLACVSCRARKLKCDRTKPVCTRCLRVSGDCVYPESRRKPTFKRRNVKELEARLAQVEDYLKDATKDKPVDHAAVIQPDDRGTFQFGDFDFGADMTEPAPEATNAAASDPPAAGRGLLGVPDVDRGDASPGHGFIDGAGGELMDLGINETLPPMEIMEALNTMYFRVQHHMVPVIHPGRYLQAFYGGALRKPPVCLQYAIWAAAASKKGRYHKYHQVFYQRARQYAEADEMKGFGEHFITVGHAQTWILIASIEAKNMLFTRASLSCSKAVRLVQMMGMDRLDSDMDQLPPALVPVMSWAELEERRRTFWGTFAVDSHASISTGWPSLINMDDIATRLPASEDAFISNKEEKAPFLDEVFLGAQYSGFAGTIVICQIFKCILKHVHRSKPGDKPEDLMNGNFWTRHRDLDNRLSSVFMFLPEKFRLPQNLRDPNAIHTNLNLHASIVCLHHAAIEMADKYNLPENVKQNSQARMKAAAEEIANIMKLASHQILPFRSPLCALSLYCATTVYVLQAKQNPKDGLSNIDIANLESIIQSMEAIGREHEITRAFLRQTCNDIELNGLSNIVRLPSLVQYREAMGATCPNIPLLLRSSITKHSEVFPVLPGRLPLGNPRGKIPSRQPERESRSDLIKGGAFVRSLTDRECFSPVLRAATSNLEPANRSSAPTNKRKRVSPKEKPDATMSLDEMLTIPPTNTAQPFPLPTPDSGMATTNLGAGASRPGASYTVIGQMSFNHAVLPDRSNSSSSSSPAFRLNDAVTPSNSSHTSPGPPTGLGNTLEENRVDLRPFQDRVATPIWLAAEAAVFAQVTESMGQDALNADGSDAWGILMEDLDWNANMTTMNG